MAHQSDSKILATDLVLSALDGQPIAAKIHSPLTTPIADMVIHGATATPMRYYNRFAHAMALQGIRVLTYDYRGIGASRTQPLRAFRASMSDWGTLDGTAALDYVKRTRSDGPLIMVGHSFGAQILGLADELSNVDAAVMIGAQFGYRQHWDGLGRARFALFCDAMLPASVSLFGYVPGALGMGEDLPGGVAREWRDWCNHPDYLVGVVEGAGERFLHFDRRALFYSFTDDSFAPRRAVEAFLASMPRASVIHRRMHPVDLGVREIGHFGFFRPKTGEKLWREVADFVHDLREGKTPKIEACEPGGARPLRESDIFADLFYHGE